MHEINLYHIQLIDLELFLAAAKYRSFTKAAEKLFTTQSWVSKRIQNMEREFNLQLFIRSGTKLIPTPAGRVLARELDSIMDQIGDALTLANLAMTGTRDVLRIGFLEWGINAFYEKTRSFIENNPQISVELYCKQFRELSDSLEEGRCDLIFTMSYETLEFDSEDYDSLVIEEVPMMVYMSRKNPLSSRPELTLTDLKKEPILTLDQKAAESYSTYISSMFKQAGIRPFISQYAQNGREHLANLMLNRGVLIASKYFLGNEFSDKITAIPLKDKSLDIRAIWKTENTNQVINHFLNEICKNTCD